MAAAAAATGRFRKGVKQVATLGPATFGKAAIEQLFFAGVDVFRLNLSHGAEDKAAPARAIRELQAEHGRPIGILVDIQVAAAAAAVGRRLQPSFSPSPLGHARVAALLAASSRCPEPLRSLSSAGSLGRAGTATRAPNSLIGSTAAAAPPKH